MSLFFIIQIGFVLISVVIISYLFYNGMGYKQKSKHSDHEHI